MEVRKGIYERFLKRPLDFICALVLLSMLSPLLLAVGGLIRINLGSPILFRQIRPGMHENLFTLYKFRTMTEQKDANGNLLPDEIRLTQFGQWLRSTSVDELPELMNVIKGEMSIVGPRPLLAEYLPRYNSQQRKRHNVRPGITGYAQVNGRNGISWEKKFMLDVKYTQHITFLGDCRILAKTIGAVLKREGINSKHAATMEDFKGNHEK